MAIHIFLNIINIKVNSSIFLDYYLASTCVCISWHISIVPIGWHISIVPMYDWYRIDKHHISGCLFPETYNQNFND